MDTIRKIIHIDMDAFYASIEQRDFPELRGKPIAVGREHERGVVAAASYEARKFGVRSAMSSKIARKKCPELIFVPHRFEVYQAVSLQIRAVFREYTDAIEPLSLDEAFLDVTQNKKQMQSATIIAKEIQARIQNETSLTASAGVSYNKFLAKIASDYNKPNGLYVIPPKDAPAFLEQLSVEKFFGVGKVTAQKMKSLGIHTGYDLKQYDKLYLIQQFGKAGVYFYDAVRGIDNRPVESNRESKSLGTEKTFLNDLETQFSIVTELYHIEKELMEEIEKAQCKGRTLILKVKYHDFKQLTHGTTITKAITNFELLHKLSKQLLSEIDWEGKKIRLLGLTVTNFIRNEELENQQLALFDRDSFSFL